MKKAATFVLVLALVFTLAGAGILSGCGGEAKVPTISVVNPGSGRVGETLSVTITGTHLEKASQVSFGPGVTSSSFMADSDDQITASIVISSGATEGSRDVSVTTTDGTVTKTAAFRVVSPLAPSVSGASPDSGEEGQTLDVTISGTNFVAVTDVSLGEGITVSYTVDSDSQISASIDIDRDAAVGLRDVSVTNSAGTATAGGVFAVTWTAALQAVIEGAEQEGTVSMIHSSLITEEGVLRLEREIKETFGVDLNIQSTPSGVMAKNLNDAVMEHQAGITPTYDLMRFQADFVVTGRQEGVFQEVDWAPLVTGDTDPDALIGGEFQGFIVIDTDYDGIVYDPRVVSAEEAPKTFADLADPKWKGEIGILSYSSWWALQAYLLSGGTEEGKQQVYDLLGQILDNDVVQGRYADLLSRYLIGELPIIFSSSKYYKDAVEKGVPAVWSFLDYAPLRRSFGCVTEGSAHPNAAKLLAVYLASPAGSKWADEEAGAGNMFYPGGIQQEAVQQAKDEGIPLYYRTDPGMLEFVLSGGQAEWQAEIEEILKTA